MSSSVDVTVVVTTFNRSAGLALALDGLIAQRMPPSLTYEVVVVDDGSTDDTPAVVANAERRSNVVRSVRIPNSGVSKARDVGVRHGRGAWIAFCDDDQIPSPQWVSALHHVATARRAACVGGPVSLLLPQGVDFPLGARARMLLGEDDFGSEVRTYPGNAHPGTGNVMIRRDVFTQVGGFDGTFAEGGEDAELFRRVRDAGLLILYAPEAQMQHVIPPSRLRVEFFEWVARRIGVSDARIHHKHEPTWRVVRRMGMRIVILLLRDLPRLALLSPRSTRRLDAICSMEYTKAFVRGSASFLAPRLFAGDAYFRRLDFRDHGGERTVNSVSAS